MTNVSIIIDDRFTPELERKKKWLTPAEYAGRVGPALQSLVEQHLAKLGANKKGWPSTRFYEKFARNVRWAPLPNGVAVTILPAIVNGRQVGIRQRVFGGTISPVTAKALAIPISPVSYGHVPSDFPSLFMLKTPKGAYLCQIGEAVNQKTKTQKMGRLGKSYGGNATRRVQARLNFLFKLQFKVAQMGDRDVLPSEEQILDAALKGVDGVWRHN